MNKRISNIFYLIKCFLILFLISPSSVFSQSGWQNIFFSNFQEILSITKIDDNNEIAFTNNSNSCIRTTNSGVNWITYECFDTICTIRGSKFSDSKNGWCVGYRNVGITNEGVIYKTTDGGFNRTKVAISSDYSSWWSVDFIDNNTGWIGGLHNKLIKTTNGGKSWKEIIVPEIREIRSIKFLDANSGWVCGRTKWIVKTTNGGENWILQFPEIKRDYATYLNSIYCIDSNYSWVTGTYVGNESEFRSFAGMTSNGGANWNSIYDDTGNSGFYGIHFFDPDIGILFGNNNYILKTTNGGRNWDTVSTGNYGNIISMDIRNENEIIAAGGSYGSSYSDPFNMIIKTTSGGNNWNLLTSNTNKSFNDIYFKSKDSGIFVGSGGTIFRSTNGGLNWIKSETDISNDLNSISFINNTTGFLFGAGGMILNTTNFGDSWNILPNTTFRNLNSSFFIDAETGWVVGSGNMLMKTTDSGNNWFFIDNHINAIHNLRSVFFLNSFTGFIMGNWNTGFPGSGQLGSSILKTTDGGYNWAFIYRNDNIVFNRLTFTDSSNGYIDVNSYIFKTTNGGNYWSPGPYNTVNFNEINFINKYTGYAAGISYDGLGYDKNGVIYKTTNEGLNWSLQFSEFGKGVNKVFALDSSYIWTSGVQNSVYRSTNGGGIIIGINNFAENIPKEYSLEQNYPNPFNPVTKIVFNIPEQENVILKVFDMLGKEIQTLVNEPLRGGRYSFDFEGNNLPSGVYYYQLKTGDFIETKKMMLIR